MSDEGEPPSFRTPNEHEVKVYCQGGWIDFWRTAVQLQEERITTSGNMRDAGRISRSTGTSSPLR